MTSLAARRHVLAATFLLTGLVLAAMGTLTTSGGVAQVAIPALLLLALLASKPYVEWRVVAAGLVAVILFIPIRRYTMPGELPFELEPYRLLVAVILAVWFAALLVDPRVRLRRSGLEAPLLLVCVATIGSLATNSEFVASLQTHALKANTFFASFVLIFYFAVSVVRGWHDVDFLAKTFVGGGSVVAVLAVIESRAHFSPFTQLDRVFPFLEPGPMSVLERGGELRAFASAEHPIALAAALVMLVPLGIYLSQACSRRWWLAVVLLTVGALATRSRVAAVMLLVVLLVFLWLRPAATRRLWPLALPLLVAIHFALPGALGTYKATFLPEGGLVAEQSRTVGDCNSDPRITDIGPSLEQASKRPFFGQGYGTRLVVGEERNACILDDQWLATLLEIGAIGLVAWLWLFVRFARMMGREARLDRSPRGWLFVGLSASVTSYAFGMLTFDAFSFIQVTFFLFLFLGLGCAARSEYGRQAIEMEAPR
jgi:hypothetical protein